MIKIKLEIMSFCIKPRAFPQALKNKKTNLFLKSSPCKIKTCAMLPKQLMPQFRLVALIFRLRPSTERAGFGCMENFGERVRGKVF